MSGHVCRCTQQNSSLLVCVECGRVSDDERMAGVPIVRVGRSAQLAQLDRKVVCLLRDGTFLQTLQEVLFT
jgi:hypothetical protein